MEKAKGKEKKVLTDEEVKEKAVKLVTVHLKKKVEKEFVGDSHLKEWLLEMDQLLDKTTFVLSEYHAMRKSLNDVLERVFEEEIRFKIRDSWYSMGKALDKKAKQE